MATLSSYLADYLEGAAVSAGHGLLLSLERNRLSLDGLVMDLGDRAVDSTFDFHFTTVNTSGVPTILAGTPALSVYEANSLVQITAGITLTVDFDTVTGLNHVRIVATTANGYDAGNDFSVVITTGTVGGNSVVGYVVATFSIEARQTDANVVEWRGALPNVLASGRVDTSVGAMAAAVLTAAAIATDAITAAKIAANAITSAEIADNAITAAKIATDAITAAKIAADAIGSSELATTAVNEIRDAILSDSTAFAGANIDATLSSRATPAQVNTEVDTALSDVNLDHLVGTVTGIPAIPAGTYIDQIMDDGTAVFDRTTDSLQAIRDTAPLGTVMRGTDNAALASVLGALADIAAAGDPTASDTVIAYIKQLINTLEGTAGIPVFPAEAAPANAVSLSEVIRAIHTDVTGLNGAVMRGTDSAALASVATEARLAELDAGNLPTDIANAQADIDNIQTRLPAALAGGRMDADVGAISTSTNGANNLERATLGIVLGAVGVGSSVTSIVTSSLDPAAIAADQFKGRIVTFARATVTASLRGQSTDITTSTAGGVLTVTALTTAPISGDTFAVT